MKEREDYTLHRNERILNRKKKRKQMYINLAMVAVLLTAVLATFVFFKPWLNGETYLMDDASIQETNTIQTESTSAESAQIIDRVSKLMLLPQEDPVIYTIDNAAALTQEQTFFAGSQDGDTLLIFPENARAVIYSSSRNIIVNAGPLTYEDDASTTTVAE